MGTLQWSVIFGRAGSWSSNSEEGPKATVLFGPTSHRGQREAVPDRDPEGVATPRLLLREWLLGALHGNHWKRDSRGSTGPGLSSGCQCTDDRVRTCLMLAHGDHKNNCEGISVNPTA